MKLFHFRKLFRALLLASLFAGIALGSTSQLPGQAESTNRHTPLVQAVASARPAVVNLRGKKTLQPTRNTAGSPTQTVRQVNGMGTGVIIDPRGYILTNFHVVEDVKRIQVTLADSSTTTGTLIAHDPKTDLALIKIRTAEPLPTIPLGTSSDVMLAETVAALGNAYGYEDTVTRGIISEIGRTVQVSDNQVYHNLLQTDAPINPGNSGGPLINLDGEMVGINVAVRVGAQGIAFAIPVNDAMEVAASFLGRMTEERVQHGIIAKTVYENHNPAVLVQSVVDFSLADNAGLKYGDVIKAINNEPCQRALDLHRNMLDKSAGEEIQLTVERQGETQNISLRLGAGRGNSPGADIWRQIGIKISPMNENQLRDIHPNYSRGLRVNQVRAGSPADREGMRPGDVLVAMHGWKTETLDNLRYVLRQDDMQSGADVVFYIIRGSEPFYGNIRIDAN